MLPLVALLVLACAAAKWANAAASLDCNDELYGSQSYDECDVCGGDGTSCLDCANVLNGSSQYDECDVCGGDGMTCLSTVQVRNGSEFERAIENANVLGAAIMRIEVKNDIVLERGVRFTGGQELTIAGEGHKISGPGFDWPLLLVNRAPPGKKCKSGTCRRRTDGATEWTWEKWGGQSAASITVLNLEFVGGSFGVEDVVGQGVTYELTVKDVKVVGAGKGRGRFGIGGMFNVDGFGAIIKINVDHSKFEDCDEEGLSIRGGTDAMEFTVTVNHTTAKGNNRTPSKHGGIAERSVLDKGSYISYLQSLGTGILVQSFAIDATMTIDGTKSNNNLGSGIVVRIPDDAANVTITDTEADENGGIGIVIVASAGIDESDAIWDDDDQVKRIVTNDDNSKDMYTLSGPTQVTIDESHANDNRHGNAFLWASALQATIKDSDFNGAKEGDNLIIMGMTDSLLFAWAHGAGLATMPWAQITDSEANGSLLGNGLVTDSVAVLLDNFDAEKNSVNGYLFVPYSPDVFLPVRDGGDDCGQDNCVAPRSIVKFQPPPPVEIDFTGSTSKFEKNGAYGIFVQRVNGGGNLSGPLPRSSNGGRPRPPPSTPIVNLDNVDLDGNGSGSLIGDVLISFDTTSPSLPMLMKDGGD